MSELNTCETHTFIKKFNSRLTICKYCGSLESDLKRIEELEQQRDRRNKAYKVLEQQKINLKHQLKKYSKLLERSYTAGISDHMTDEVTNWQEIVEMEEQILGAGK